MPIEIREIIIKTEIASINGNRSSVAKEKEISQLKKQLLEECKRMITGNTKKEVYKR
jgi:hypothetical protein